MSSPYFTGYKPKVSIQSLIFTDSFIEIKLLLPDGKLYGIGERRGSVELNDTDWWEHRKGRFFMVFAQYRSFFSIFSSMWNTDGPPRENKQLYGEHPIWLTLDDDLATGGIMWASLLQSPWYLSVFKMILSV